jgi:peptidoglycan/xylan/chitin deacetylase (PgdA/CDA1 family)
LAKTPNGLMNDLRSLVLKAGLNGLYWSGAHRIAAPFSQGAGAILMFHHVRPSAPGGFQPNDHLEITPEFLRTVVLRLRARDIDIVDMDEAMRRMASDQPERRFAVLTFDDGYRNNFTHAYPVLKALNAPFTVYLATGLLDRTAMSWWEIAGEIVARNARVRMTIGDERLDLRTDTPRRQYSALDRIICALVELPEDALRAAVQAAADAHGVDLYAMMDAIMMDWDEARSLAADPLVTIGAHTVNHYALARLDEARARHEMHMSVEQIADRIGERPRHFAYPYGSAETADQREFRLASELGFDTAVTTRRGVLGPQSVHKATSLPRVSINGRYQSVRYLDVLLSGLPYVMKGGLERLGVVSSTPVAGRAAASTR